MSDVLKILPATFYRTASGSEPVRVWLKELGVNDRRIIGEDIRTVEFGWPIGMPLCRSISGYKELWEIRSRITDGNISRIIFYTRNGKMILLHGFIKKTQKTPTNELEIAAKRQKEHKQHGE